MEKLAQFEILGKIGAGGMGEVFRARDTRLGREVALKILPEALALDAERIARFQREAQVLASLNHPNIASIYGLEEAGEKRVLVMELAEGENLASRIEAGPIPLEDVVEIAHQVALALEEAHEKGIVHRDLKPANVQVNGENRVKVLDFGLAKAFEENPADSGANLSQSPTITGAMTGANVILGTAAYMSPEQAKGKKADRRADIWGFGVVLFEMLSGRQVFEGETISETLASVMKDDIPWDRLPASTPPPIRRLLERCLEKDARRRLQAIGEARIALETYRDGGGAPGEPGPVGRESRRNRSSLASLIPWAITGLAIGVATVMMNSRPPTVVSEAPVRKFRLDVNLAGGNPEISPDGGRIAYVEDGSLWVRDLNDLGARRLVDPGPGTSQGAVQGPFWSPDGRNIGYGALGRLWKVDVEGGSPTSLCSVGEAFVGGVWLPDDRIFFTVPRGDMMAVSARGGDPVVVSARRPGDIDFHAPSPVPGGAIIYSLHRTEGVDTIELFDGTERRDLLRIEIPVITGDPQVVNNPVYSPTGHIVYQREKGNVGLWALPFDASTRSVTGEPFLIVAHGYAPSVSRDGTLVYTPVPEAGLREMIWVNRRGEEEGVLGEPIRGLDTPALSPDGTKVAFIASDGDAGEVWVRDVAQGTRTRLTFTPDNETRPTWFPGTNLVVFNAATDSGAAICMRPADGGDETKVLVMGGRDPVFSSDGRTMVYQKSSSVAGDLVIRGIEGGGDPRVLVSGGSGFYDPRISPDGAYLAYQSWEAGTPITYIRPMDGSTGKWEISESWESSLHWLPGEILLTVNRDGGSWMYSLPVDTGSSLGLGSATRLFDLEALGIEPYRSFAVTPDGERFLLVRALATDEVRGGIVVVENWAKEFED